MQSTTYVLIRIGIIPLGSFIGVNYCLKTLLPPFDKSSNWNLPWKETP